ncbi:MAG: hypothetical protein PUE17_02930, partial [Bacteroidales bacterium]|nr:hypothetical protein [Bacteroidales bacterium]
KARAEKRKAVQGERKGNKKLKFFKMPFPNRSRLYVKAAGFSFYLPSRSLTPDFVLTRAGLVLSTRRVGKNSPPLVWHSSTPCMVG